MFALSLIFHSDDFAYFVVSIVIRVCVCVCVGVRVCWFSDMKCVYVNALLLLSTMEENEAEIV